MGRWSSPVAAALLGVVGAACAAPRAAEPDEALRVVTYNIRHGVGLDGALDLERTADVLNALAPDLVALQEVDDGARRSDSVDQAARLGELTGLEHAFGAFMDYDGGRYGMALLSRSPVVAVEPLRLPDGNEPRIALLAEIELSSGARVHVADVHFDWVDDDGFRFAQASALAAQLETLDGPFIVLGDFNDEPGSRTLELFAARSTPVELPEGAATWPADAPTVAIDHVFAGPPAAWSVDPGRVVDEPLASDHRPVLVELTLRR